MRDDLQEGDRDTGFATRTADLRILATSDIHMQLLGFDYVEDRQAPHHGLAGLATLIADARDEAEEDGAACILLDNGDLLQGSPLGTHLSEIPVDAQHPIVASLDHLAYDAIGLGNHDLDHGLDYLNALADALPAPVICSNLKQSDSDAVRRNALIRCALPSANPETQATLQIGVVSALPERTAIWNAPQLEGRARVLRARQSVQTEIDALKRQGAEPVILLAHMGMEADAVEGAGDDDARSIASLDHIDVVISGHTHLRLPGTDHAGFASVDSTRGTLFTRPAAMPGFEASDLAVLDIRLRHDGQDGWQLCEHHCQLRTNSADIEPDAGILAKCSRAHTDTRAALSAPCTISAQTIHNYFSIAMPTRTCALWQTQSTRRSLPGSTSFPKRNCPFSLSPQSTPQGAEAARRISSIFHPVRSSNGILRGSVPTPTRSAPCV